MVTRRSTGVALVGAGYWGRRIARNLVAADGCELRAVCDVDPGRAREVADVHGGVPMASLTDALADDAVHAVVVATPSSTHAALVAEAIASSRHVLVEKPLAGTPADAARLATRAADRGRVLMCDQTYRFAPAVVAIRELLADPEFGTVARIESCRTNHGHDQPDVDVFWDLAHHDLAIVDAVLPAGLHGVIGVRATACDLVGHGRPHRGELVLEPASGATARITVDWHADAKARAMRFASADHEVTWDDVDGPDVRHDGTAVPVDGGEPLAAVIAEFLSAIADGRLATCGPVQELPILTLLAAASQSAASDGAPVVVDLAADVDAAGSGVMELAGARALITGGAGVVGSTLVDALAPLDLAEIVVYDDFSRGLHENLAPARAAADAGGPPITVVVGDVRDRDALATALRGSDIVFHQAAIRLPHCASDPRLALEVMVDGTFNVVEAAHAAGVQRFVAASSASIYGSATTFPITEDHDPYGNRTLYGAAKVFGEQLYRSYHEMFGFDYVALRYFNVYGPRMDAHTAYTEVLIRWMQRIDDGLPPLIHGAGDQTMDFVYVTDVARANVLAATASATDAAYNVATGVETSLVELARALLHAMGSDLDVEFGPDREVPAVERRLAAIDRAARELGFTAEVDLTEGLAGLVAWWRARPRD